MREIEMRHRVYPRLVSTGKMSACKAERAIAAISAVAETLESAEFWVTSWRPVTCARSRQATAQ